MEKIDNNFKSNKGTDLYKQGGHFDLPYSLYSLSFPYIKNGDKILNFGCGVKFNFERYLTSLFKVAITGVDMLDIKKNSSLHNFL